MCADKADEYKQTVFLPKTDFPMRGDLGKREPEIAAKWAEMDLYRRLRETSKGRKKWVLHWGPPYANGDAHIGHAFTKTLKDVVNKSWQMMGYDAPLVPGWDCHGLPIEWKIEEQYRAAGKDKDQVDKVAFRAECRAFAQKWAKAQAESFKRLGVVADFDNPYMTIANSAEAGILREIYKFLNNGLLYRGVKPVMWSTVEKTALAEAEVEYKEHKSTAIWVKFPVVKAADESLIGTKIVIWTTTPWTIPANRAVAFGPDIEYGVFRVEGTDERLIFALALADAAKEKAGIENWTLEKRFKGYALEGTVCRHPLHADGYDFDVPALEADFVAHDTGTGFVHIAPGHGMDDYMLVREENIQRDTLRGDPEFGGQEIIPIESAIDNEGKYTDKHPLFAGKKVFANELDKQPENDADIAVIKALAAAGALLAKGGVRHDYPHSWRSKAPVVFRTTPQWFIGMDITPHPDPHPEGEGDGRSPAGEGTLRQRALKAIDDTRWLPPQGKNRIGSMIAGRPDWCISRQRLWGVPIALFLDKKTGEPLKDTDVQARVIAAFEKETADAWWTHDPQEFLGDKYKAEDYEQVFDTVDVWFDSASTHAFVLEQRPDLKWPADLYLEGSDQHRGWFHTSLLESCGTRGRAPYDAVLTHGFVLDEKGYKMSKSQGNVVAPDKVWNQYGADILRLWAMTTDYAEDVRIGDTVLKANADLYRRIRNTFRYLLGALDGFSAAEAVDLSDERVPELERLVLHWLAEKDAQVRESIKGYEFGRLAQLLHHFCNNELSAFYFDIRKDRLYCDRPDSFERRACRTVMAHVFDCLVTWFAPILSFTCEEAWSHRPAGVFDDADSVHLRTFPEIPAAWRDEALAARWEEIRAVRKQVLEAIEPMRASKELGSSLEARPVIRTDLLSIQQAGTELADLCITSQIDVQGGGPSLTIEKADGHKCARCWKVLPEVGEDQTHPELCHRCADAVDWHEKNREAA